MTQNEKLSAAETERLRAIVDAYFQSDLQRKIAERDAIDRRAEFVALFSVVSLALLGLGTLAAAIRWVAR